jgi:hypothetical protein
MNILVEWMPRHISQPDKTVVEAHVDVDSAKEEHLFPPEHRGWLRLSMRDGSSINYALECVKKWERVQ